MSQGEDWLVRHPAALAQLREFIQVSVAAHADAEARELHKQRIAATHLRWLSCALAGLLLVALFMTWFARRQKVLAESRALAAQSEEMLSRDPGRALDLAIRGWEMAQTSETAIALTKVWPQSLSILKHDNWIVVAVFSPDGERILTASYDHTARVWNSADGRLLFTLQGHTDDIQHAAFSPDGRHIVTASSDHTARVWNTADGRLLATLLGHTDIVFAGTFSHDSQRIATASWDGTGRVWSAADGRLLATLLGHTDKVWGAEFFPDGQRIITASADHTARVWQVLTLDDIKKILIHQ